MVQFGGITASSSAYLNDVQEFDGQSWVAVAPADGRAPSARDHHSACFDSDRQEVLICGGTTKTAFCTDVWSWNGQRWLQLSATGFPSRADAAFAYDSRRHRAVVFSGTRMSADTWEFSGTTWSQVTTAVSPPAGSQRMAFDEQRGVMVLVTATAPLQVWEYDGSSWTQRNWTSGGPTRTNGICFDPASRRIVSTGDYTAANEMPQTWAWDGVAWSRVTKFAPAAISTTGITTDTKRGRIVMYANGLWEFDGSKWELRSTDGPTTATNVSAAYHEAAGVTVLVAAVPTGQPSYQSQCWTWDGTTMTNLGVPPMTARSSATMTYDPVRKKVFLVGGQSFDVNVPNLDDTWSFDGATWRLAASGAVGGTAARIYFDTIAQQLMVYDGHTHSFNGSAWVDVSDIGMVGDPKLCVVFDPVRKTAVCVGGINFSLLNWIQERTSYKPAFAGTMQPVTTRSGRSAQLNVHAWSVNALTYQWLRNGSALPGSTFPTLLLSDVRVSDAGTYRCVVTDTCGDQASQDVSLNVLCSTDTDGDGFVDWFDFFAFVECFTGGVCENPDLADIDGDGTLDMLDFSAFVDQFENGC